MSRTNPKAKAKAMPASSVTMLNAMSTVRRCRKVKRSWLPSAAPVAVSAAASSGPLLTLATLPSLLTLSLLAAILFFGGIAEGLKCHMCGQYNEGVGSITPCSNYSKEIAHLYLKECTKKSEKFCVKYVSELSTVRDCATECVEKEIWETQTYCCKEDGCNSGENLKYSVVLLALPFFKIIWVVLRDFLKVRR